MTQDKQAVRVRIAPSPTGDPHVGLAYMTLFNWTFARQNKGSLILRIEDTDQQRFRSSSEADIMKSLKWLGLSWNEGPDCGGDFGPYRQSERTQIYQEHVDQLVHKGFAYPCTCTSQRLDELRTRLRKEGKNPRYDGQCRSKSFADLKNLRQEKEKFVIRLKVKDTGEIKVFDELRGEISFANEQIDDQVLLKSDGFPTYHLANVVDDHLMQISHVIRAEEWISSTPKHVLLYEAFGWQAPKFVHLPILRNKDRSKISKRKNPTSLNFYRRKGILPQAMVNFLALMGWAYDDKTEIFGTQELLEKFSLKDIHLGGPVFDLVKLLHINSHYIKNMSVDEFTTYLQKEVISKDLLQKLYPLMKERLQSFDEFFAKTNFFFSGELSYDLQALIPKGHSLESMKKVFSELLLLLDNLDGWNEKNLTDLCEKHRLDLGLKPRDYLMPLRLIVSGRKDSPPLYPMLEVLGKEIVRSRLFSFVNILSS